MRKPLPMLLAFILSCTLLTGCAKKEEVTPPTGKEVLIVGQVMSEGKPVPDAVASIEVFGVSATTDATGTFKLSTEAIEGEFQLVIKKEGYTQASLTVDLTNPGMVNIGKVEIVELGSIKGTVRIEGEEKFGGVKISLEGTDISTTTADDGTYRLLNIPPGSYVLVVGAGTTLEKRIDVDVVSGKETIIEEITLKRLIFDDFGGPSLRPVWTFRSPDGNDRYELKGGWIVFDIDANQDIYITGVDRAPLLLTNPPTPDDVFTIETVVDVLVDSASQPPASHAGLILFREDRWAYTLWGPYNNVDIRVEDCVGSSYRWREQTQIGINAPIDKDVYLKIIKDRDKLEFYYKDKKEDQWQLIGTDTRIGPYLEKGTYKVGIFLKNWGGSIPMKARFDYFDMRPGRS
jgi:hypothetical protein